MIFNFTVNEILLAWKDFRMYDKGLCENLTVVRSFPKAYGYGMVKT